MFLASFGPGGIERLVRSTIGPLHARGVDVCILSLTSVVDKIEEVRDYGVRAYPLSAHWKPVRFPLYQTAAELEALRRAYAAEGRIHVIHAHHYPCIAAAPVVSKLYKAPYVATHHNIQEPWQKQGGPRAALFRAEMRYAFRHASRIFAISQAVADEIEGLAGSKLPQMQLLEVRIDDIYFESADPGAKRDIDVIMVGRLAKQKNVLFALEVFARIAAKRASFKAVLVGGGPMEGEVRAKIDALSLGKNVELVGELSAKQIIETANRSKILYMPSLFEGLSAAFIEMMALGLDAVVSPIPGFVKVFPTEPGVEFAPNDDYAANEAALTAAIDRYEYRPRPHWKARFAVGDYNDRLADTYWEFSGLKRE